MPNRTIYIRNEDIAKFDALEDRPRFIRDALANLDIPQYNKAVTERKEIEKITGPITERVAKMTFPPKAVATYETPSQRADRLMLEERNRRMR